MEKLALWDKIREFARMVRALDEDPEELLRQIRPLLSKLQIITGINRNKTVLIPGQIQGSNSLYCVVLRRRYMLTPDHIERLKRNVEFLNYMVWHQEGIELYFWYPYQAPEEETKPGTPKRPGLTPAIPGLAPLAPKN